jgi:uncharacterized repeat protein (TIGR01451 family)
MAILNKPNILRGTMRTLAAVTVAALAFGLGGTANAQATGADVSVTKTAPDMPYGGGSTIEYSIHVENNGPATAQFVTVDDTTPPNTSFLSITAPAGWNCVTPAPGGTGLIRCTAPSLTIGAMADFVVTLRIFNEVPAGVLITNTATVDSNSPDPLPSNNTSSFTFTTAGGSVDTAAVYDAATGSFFLRNFNQPGPADVVFSYGPVGASIFPLRGDWNGDGIDTIGVYDQATGAFFLRNSNSAGPADLVFTYGAGGAGLIPITGDWNGDTIDTVGLYDPATGSVFLRNTNSSGGANIVFTFGGPGAFTPLAGDWNGDNVDTIGLYVPSTGSFFLRNANSNGPADLTFTFGPPFAAPVTGDWNADNIDTIGIFVPATAAWFLRNSNTNGGADAVFSYGFANGTPLAGDWNGL